MNETGKQPNLKEIYHLLYSAFGRQHWWPGDTSFEISVGAILTQNTNWGNVEKAIWNLKKAKVLTVRALLKLPKRRVASLIKPSGYYNIKAERLNNFLNLISNRYQGSMQRMKREDTDSLRKHLLSVNGIGPETADSILLYALGKPVFVVDAYTKRILQRHCLITEEATYHEIQGLFHEALPADIPLYNEYHALLVKLGKEFCRPKPACFGCPLEGF